MMDRLWWLFNSQMEHTLICKCKTKVKFKDLNSTYFHKSIYWSLSTENAHNDSVNMLKFSRFI